MIRSDARGMIVISLQGAQNSAAPATRLGNIGVGMTEPPSHPNLNFCPGCSDGRINTFMEVVGENRFKLT